MFYVMYVCISFSLKSLKINLHTKSFCISLSVRFYAHWVHFIPIFGSNFKRIDWTQVNEQIKVEKLSNKKILKNRTQSTEDESEREREEITPPIKELEKHKIFVNNDQQHSIKRITISNFTEAIFFILRCFCRCRM